MFVQDKSLSRGPHAARPAGHNPPGTEVIDAAAGGTSGAKSLPIECAKARSPAQRRVNRGVSSTGFLAAQLRRSALETSRALLLLPPSLVRSGALRSDFHFPVTASFAAARGAR